MKFKKEWELNKNPQGLEGTSPPYCRVHFVIVALPFNSAVCLGAMMNALFLIISLLISESIKL